MKRAGATRAFASLLDVQLDRAKAGLADLETGAPAPEPPHSRGHHAAHRFGAPGPGGDESRDERGPARDRPGRDQLEADAGRARASRSATPTGPPSWTICWPRAAAGLASLPARRATWAPACGWIQERGAPRPRSSSPPPPAAIPRTIVLASRHEGPPAARPSAARARTRLRRPRRLSGARARAQRRGEGRAARLGGGRGPRACAGRDVAPARTSESSGCRRATSPRTRSEPPTGWRVRGRRWRWPPGRT